MTEVEQMKAAAIQLVRAMNDPNMVRVIVVHGLTSFLNGNFDYLLRILTESVDAHVPTEYCKLVRFEMYYNSSTDKGTDIVYYRPKTEEERLNNVNELQCYNKSER